MSTTIKNCKEIQRSADRAFNQS